MRSELQIHGSPIDFGVVEFFDGFIGERGSSESGQGGTFRTFSFLVAMDDNLHHLEVQEGTALGYNLRSRKQLCMTGACARID